MFIRIETSSGLPITRQIIDQIASQIAGSALMPGDRLPSVRELAKQIGVNQNTILRAYERLTDQGLLERIHGSGTYVCEKKVRRVRKLTNLVRDDVQRLAEKAVALGIKRSDLNKLLSQSMTRATQQQAAAKRKRA